MDGVTSMSTTTTTTTTTNGLSNISDSKKRKRMKYKMLQRTKKRRMRREENEFFKLNGIATVRVEDNAIDLSSTETTTKDLSSTETTTKADEATVVTNDESSEEEVLLSKWTNRPIDSNTKCKENKLVFKCGVCWCKLGPGMGSTLQHFREHKHNRNLFRKQQRESAQMGYYDPWVVNTFVNNAPRVEKVVEHARNFVKAQKKWDSVEMTSASSRGRGVGRGVGRGAGRGAGRGVGRGAHRGRGVDRSTGFNLQRQVKGQINVNDNQFAIPSASQGQSGSKLRRSLVSALLEEEKRWIKNSFLNNNTLLINSGSQLGISSASPGESDSKLRRSHINALLEEEERWVKSQSLNNTMPPPPWLNSSADGSSDGSIGTV